MEHSRETRKQLGLGPAAVYHLSQRMHSPHHKLYSDTFLTTYSVLELLAEKDIHAAGTKRATLFAKAPLLSDKDMSGRRRGSCDEVVS